MQKNSPEQILTQLIKTVNQLRDPVTGCPWTKQKQLEDIIPYTIEETYEVIDAIEQHDFTALKKELGDLFYQILLYAKIAEQQQQFNLADILQALMDKINQRQLLDFDENTSAEEVNQHWQQRKRETLQHYESILDSVEKNLNPLIQSKKLQQVAAEVGFDWSDTTPIFDKIQEEIVEIQHAEKTGSKQHLTDEIGDLLFAVINLARHYDIDADLALHRCNNKFRKRFLHIENGLKKQNISLEKATLEQMEELWEESKK